MTLWSFICTCRIISDNLPMLLMRFVYLLIFLPACLKQTKVRGWNWSKITFIKLMWRDCNIFLVNYSQGPKLSLLLGKGIRDFNLKFLSNKTSKREKRKGQRHWLNITIKVILIKITFKGLAFIASYSFDDRFLDNWGAK